MKRLLSLCLTLIMLMSFGLQSFAITFSDVPEGEWYHDFVYDLAEKQVINGYPDGTFKPQEYVTVGAFLKLIITASAGDKVNYKILRPDYDHWAAPYLKVAENYGILQHGEYLEADLDRSISRLEIVRILSKCDLIIVGTWQKGSSKTFTDTEGLTSEDFAYLGHAVGIGVISGDPEGTFRPNDNLRRSECAKVIYTFTNREKTN